MKRVAALVLAAVAIGFVAAPAGADEEVPSGSPWGGSTVTRPAPVTSPIVELTIKGRVQNNDDLSYSEPPVAVTFSEDPDTRCDPAPAGPATPATMTGPTFTPNTLFPTWKRYAYTADVPFAPERNGDYKVFVCINGRVRLDTVAQVRLPAPAVTNLVATAAGHEVDLTWDDMRGLAPDLSGYRIERSLAGSAFEPVETIGADLAAYTDSSLPAEGGDVTYRVIALRPHVEDGAASNDASATYEPAPAGAGAPGTGGAGGSGGSSGGGATASAGGSAGGGGSGRPGGGNRPARSSRPAITIPRVGTPSRNFFPALLAPPVDTGYSEQLPYDLAEDGDELAGDELASDPVDGLPGKGLAIPIATGLVLAVWALHLRFLARASRPEYQEGVEILG